MMETAKIFWAASAARLAVAVAAVLAVAGCKKGDDPVKLSLEGEIEMYQGEVRTLVANVVGGSADGIVWSSSDAAVVKADSGGILTAVAIGEATVTAALGGSSASCRVKVAKAVPITQIVMPENFSVVLGVPTKITHTVLPFNASNQNLEWSSSDVSVATVSGGNITGFKVGRTTIRAIAPGTAGTAGEISAQCTVAVTDIPVERVELSKTTLDLRRGATERLAATVWPENARHIEVVWSSGDPFVASVSADGTVTGVAQGTVTVTATVGNAHADCTVNVSSTPVVGDYFYADNTWSAEPNPNKEMIGIIFWIGDPTADDAALRADHPDCNRGLVVSLVEHSSAWQSQSRAYNSTVTEWLAAHTTLPGIMTNETDTTGKTKKILGYSHTRALEAFNAAPENVAWKVDIVEKLATFRAATPAAEGSSGWFLPSIKELEKLCTGESGGRPDWTPITNRQLMNEKLMAVGGNQLESYLYKSTLEINEEEAVVFSFRDAAIGSDFKVTSRWVRYVLAF